VAVSILTLLASRCATLYVRLALLHANLRGLQNFDFLEAFRDLMGYIFLA
jgi:hypothetical protein